MTALRRVGVTLLAPALAIAFSLLVTALVLLATGTNPITTFEQMVDYASSRRTQTLILNTATTYYLAAVAVAIGFRMNLFNIGVDGQYRLAAMLSAALGGAIALPAPLHVTVIVVTAMLVGAMWAGIAGILEVTRGRQRGHLHDHAELHRHRRGRIPADRGPPGRWRSRARSNIGTKPIPPSGQIPGFHAAGRATGIVRQRLHRRRRCSSASATGS